MNGAPMPLSLSDISTSLVGLVASASRSIVAVHSHRSRGSGFIWRPGLVVTSDEALADEGPIEVVLPGGDIRQATVKGRDAATDIALLRIDPASAPPASLDAAAGVAAGALVLVVASEDGRPVSAIGIVASAGPAWRSMRGGDIDALIELDVRLRPRSEGGLAVDAGGKAIGMVVRGSGRRVLVIPSGTIDRVAGKLDAEGRIARGYVGLGLQPVQIEGDDKAMGGMVMSVDTTGPGAAAGVRQGDIIIGWNGRPLRGLRAVMRELGPASVGTVVRLTAKRSGEPVEFNVRVAARPDT